MDRKREIALDIHAIIRTEFCCDKDFFENASLCDDYQVAPGVMRFLIRKLCKIWGLKVEPE